MKFKCIGEKCKYFENDKCDCPGHCGLVNVINNIFAFVNLPQMKPVYSLSSEFVDCPFNDFDICRDNNLDYIAVYDLNKAIKDNFYVSPNDYIIMIDSFKKGGSKK